MGTAAAKSLHSHTLHKSPQSHKKGKLSCIEKEETLQATTTVNKRLILNV